MEINETKNHEVSEKKSVIWFIIGIISFLISFLFFCLLVYAAFNTVGAEFGQIFMPFMIILFFSGMIFTYISYKKNKNNKLGKISKYVLIWVTLSIAVIWISSAIWWSITMNNAWSDLDNLKNL